MSQSFENLKTNIRSAIDTKNFVAAKRYSETMLLLYPGSAESYYLNARLKNENDVEPAQADALIAAERAVTIEPNNFTYNYYCGAIYLQYKLYELALPMLRKSTLMEPKAPLSQLCLAECYFEIGKGDRAVTHFRNALRLDETGLNRDMIRYKLAHCLVASGQSQAADALLKRLIKDQGEYYLSALSEVVISSKEKLDSKIGKLVQAALIERVNSPPDQEILHIVMGRLYERAGNSEKAFEFWTKSREIAKTIKYNLRDHAAELTKAKALYTAELFEKTAGYADPSEAPVFIVGMPRTGTTLTEQIIAAHSQAIGVGELARWNKVRDHFERGFQIGNHVEQLVTNAKNGQLKFLAKELLHIFHVVADRQASRIVEKTPHNFGCLGYFHLICPRAKFIHIRRNPADTFISTYQNRFNRSHGYAYDQLEYVKEYIWHEQMMDLWKSLFPELILTINYEQLVAEPEHVAKKIFEHIGLPWEEQTLRFFENTKTVRTFSTHQVRNPVNTASVDRWRRYEKHLGPFIKAYDDAKFEYKYVPV